MLNVTVRRRQWLRATSKNEGKLYSFLLQPRSNGNKMCCLGFACRAAGLKAYQIRGETVPDGLFEERADFPVSLQKLINRDTGNSRTCCALMAANDNHDIGARTREARVKKLGKKVGINFRFVD